MNTQATLDPSIQTDDLVFRYLGGESDGQTVSISTKSCMLEVTRRTTDHGLAKDKCAIYRGSAGVAVQSHGTDVLINGEPKSVHWLKIGDRIQLSDEQSVEIIQLGSMETEPNDASAPAFPSDPGDQQSPSNPLAVEFAAGVDEPVAEIQDATQDDVAQTEESIDSVTESVDVEGDRIDFVSDAMGAGAISAGVVASLGLSSEEDQLQTPASDLEPAPFTPADVGTSEQQAHQPVEDPTASEEVANRFASLETSVSQLGDQAANVERRFDRLEDSLNALTEHLERLAVSSLSNSSVAAQPAGAEALGAMTSETIAPVEQERGSIADLFHELGNDDEPVTQAATTQESFEAPAADIPVASELTSQALIPSEEVESARFVPTLENLGSTNPDGGDSVNFEPGSIDEAAADEPANGFAEQMMGSIKADAPTLSSAEIANQIGLSVAEAAELPTTPARAEARTESVAEIFARLQSATPAVEVDSPDNEISKAPVLRETVKTTFEDIQASISAALDEEVPEPQAVAEADETAGLLQQSSAPASVEPVAAPEPADDVSSVMDRLRASLENEDENEYSDNEAGPVDVASIATESASEAADAGPSEDDTVDDYMSMLLSRMRGDSDSSEASQSSAAIADAATDAAELEAARDAAEVALADQTPLTAEEFTPRQKAAPIKSLDKMRELANSTSRSAVQRSVRAQKEERKKSLILQALSLGSLTLAGLMFATSAHAAGIAFVGIFALTTAYLLYDILRPAQELVPVKQRDATEVVQQITEADAVG